MSTGVLSLFFLAAFVQPIFSARILVLMPYYGASHFFVFEQLFEELARRGHSMDVLSYVPRKTPVPNYRDISLPKLLNGSSSTLGFFTFDMYEGIMSANTLTNLYGQWLLSDKYHEVHSLPEVVALANGTYDAVLIEMFNSHLFHGIAYKTGAPVIGLSSCAILPWAADSLAAPNQPSYLPTTLADRSYQMSFFQRVLNTIDVWFARAFLKLAIDRNAQALAERYLGPLPPLADIAANNSLLLVHTHYSYLSHMPLPPSVIEVGGLNLKPLKPLASDVEKILNDSNGVIYFSMGSALDGKSMKEEKKQIFVKVLGGIGKTVLWKQEETIKNKPKNIITRPWFAQRDLLQHPKVELFISHCGNLGLTEGVDAGVPIICIPMYGDQHTNARSAVDHGYSIFLDYHTLTEDTLRTAVNEILTNNRYKETAKKVQAAFRDRPLSPMETSIYWIEYVIKHGAATRAPYSHMPIWLRDGVDVAIFLFSIVLLSAYIVIHVFTNYFTSKKSIKKEKQS